MNKIKIYIASSFDFVEEIKMIETRLRIWFGDRLEFTSDWWNNNIDLEVKHDDTGFSDFLGNNYTKALAECDFNAIEKSDIVIVYNRKENKKLTGALIEAGYAMGKGKSVILYGWFKKSAMFARANHIYGFDELLMILKFYMTGYTIDVSNIDYPEELDGIIRDYKLPSIELDPSTKSRFDNLKEPMGESLSDNDMLNYLLKYYKDNKDKAYEKSISPKEKRNEWYLRWYGIHFNHCGICSSDNSETCEEFNVLNSVLGVEEAN